MKTNTNWAAALDKLKRESPDGFTTREFSDAVGLYHTTGQKKLSELVRLGHAKFVGKRSVLRIDGCQNTVPVYNICRTEKPQKR